MAPPKSTSSTNKNDPRGLSSRGTDARDRGLFHPPILTQRCYSREVEVPSTFNEFDKYLKNWIATCVTSRTRDPRTGEAFHREQPLVGNNRSSIDVWEQLVPLLPKDSKAPRLKVRIYADYEFVSEGREEWGVASVRFSLRDVPSPPAPRDDPRHVDYAVLKNDILSGESQLRKLVDEAHAMAQHSSPMPKVTVGGKDLIPDLVKRDWRGLAKNVAKGYAQDLGRSNAAYDVTKRRSILFDAYIDGAISALFPSYNASSKRADAEEQRFFELGKSRFEALSTTAKRQLALAAVEAVRADPTPAGAWFVTGPLDWDFESYEARARDPSVVSLGLAKWFHTRANLIDAP